MGLYKVANNNDNGDNDADGNGNVSDNYNDDNKICPHWYKVNLLAELRLKYPTLMIITHSLNLT